MQRSGRRGQALVMVTFSLVAIMGIMALATDMGVAHYTRKAAQGAADAAAKASVMHVLATVGNGPVVCGTSVGCQDNWTCPANPEPGSNLDTACLYAQRNGFTNGGKSRRQTVTVSAQPSPPGPPTAPGVNDVYYWVTVTVSERVPAMFSAVYGSGPQVVSSRATAAVTSGVQGGTLFLLNRQNDTSPVGTGVNLDAGGNPTVTAPGGIYMSSNKDGAGNLQGNPTVTAPRTYIRGAGTVTLGGSATWTATPKNGFGEEPAYFTDPMSGKGQPTPLPAGGLNNWVAVPSGNLSGLPQPLHPGQYYATDSKGIATGALLTVNGAVTFSDDTTGFGNYVLYGGLSFGNKGSGSFSPGRYVLAGVKSGSGSPILSLSTQSTLTDHTAPGVQNTDAGEIFIFTDGNYPGLDGSRPTAVEAIKNSLVFGPVNLQAGNKQVLALHGLNRTSVNLPADLKDFAPTAFWQDQRNSRVKYDANGNVDFTSCGGGHTIDNPCLTPGMSASTTPEFHLQAHPNTSVYGLIYQPRGAWMSLQGSGTITSPLVFITGALDLQGGADIALLNARDALRIRMATLVE